MHIPNEIRVTSALELVSNRVASQSRSPHNSCYICFGIGITCIPNEIRLTSAEDPH